MLFNPSDPAGTDRISHIEGALVSVSGGQPDVTAGAATGVAATDTAVLQAAINATPSGGRLMLPRGTYVINAALTITNHIRIEGMVALENWVSSGGGGALGHPNSPGVLGTVISQKTAATDVMQFSGSALSVAVRNLGLTFDAAILNTNTGHGINAYPALVNGSGHDSGLMGFMFENVIVYGHDGSHYAFQLRNCELGQMNHLRAYGGGGLLLDCDSFVGNFGNCVFNDLFFEVSNSGTAHGVQINSRTAYTASSGHLNMLTFIRPQVNIVGAAATAGTQYFWTHVAGSNLPSKVELISPDLEGSGANPCDFGGVNGGTLARRGIINPTITNGVDSDRSYKAVTATGTSTFIVPDGIYKLRVRVIGAGGGGGGGGSNAGAAANSGGGGGGAGMVTDAEIVVTPRQSFTVTVGTGGTSGGGGGSGGNVGIVGGLGVQSSFGSLVKANGGGGGGPGPVSATTAAGGGLPGRTGSATTQFIPGFGGPSSSTNGIDSIVLPPGVVGGAGGGASNTTLGGNGGGASTVSFPAFAAQGGGAVNGQGAAPGGVGTTATTPGCGGGGGGGAPSGGAGGNGGVGAPGMVEIWW